MSPRQSWKSQIQKFIENPAMHFLWLKSLSYLEYIGYRKMIKSIPQPISNHRVFQHVSDEIKHSFLFQKLAEKILKSNTEPLVFEKKLISFAEDYFQALDSKVEEWVEEVFSKKNPEYSYMLTSYVIEKRAIKVYPFYQLQLEEEPMKQVLMQIIKDEQDHLDLFESQLKKIPQLKGIKHSEIWSFEEKLFKEYMNALEKYQSTCLSTLKKVS